MSNIIVQYDHDKSSPIDILGYCMSIAAKITSINLDGRSSLIITMCRNV